MKFILTLELRLGLMYLVYLVKLMRVNETKDSSKTFKTKWKFMYVIRSYSE